MNGADIWVVQGGSGLSFPLKSSERVRITGDTVRKEFQGNEAMQTDVFGLINHTHAAAAELLNDAVVRDGLADKRLGLHH
jgi:hypothetical protein